MDIQVRLVHGTNIDNWNGAAVHEQAAPDVYFIFINADQPAEEQRRTMRHEVWHIINGDHQHKIADVAVVEEEARRHEEDPEMDAIISRLGLWKNAVMVDAQEALYSRFKDEGKEMHTDASGSRVSGSHKPRTCRIDDRTAADV